ncbi:putative B3 domain-containing protein Os04g0676650 isoform X1 [Aegilops tauschii subsp. strangulata]|uniref:TF-B3 domain-containing protein n=1 Tax=Aegilops tauschii subsp. strangulata TaxID=200361 RepID=A0A453DFU8_AEGTS|nr:putative B3 domain-containing protein Os04g0676650 isoform X1 [Aegilops tauschii subsp. strangulata]
MADANGSPSPSPQHSSGGEAVTGDFVAVPGAGPHASFQALLASVGGHDPHGAVANVLAQRQYQEYEQLFGPPGPLIQAPPQPMPLQVQAPSPTPPPPHCAQSNLLMPAGTHNYQHWQPPAPQIGVAAAPRQAPMGLGAGVFGDWTMYNVNSTVVSVACGSSSSVRGNNNNGYHQSSRLCSPTAWPNNFMPPPTSPYSVYPHGIQQQQGHQQAITYNANNNNHQQGNSGFVSNFTVDPPLLPAQCFQPISPASNNRSSPQYLDEARYAKRAKRRTQKRKNSEDPPEMGSENAMMLDENHNFSNQAQQFFTTRFNCKDYHMIVWKELTNSDVGNIGRIVVPKRDAEANLPALLERDGLILKMEDMRLPVTWNFKFRYWPNNKSRMYVLESTGEFSKNHNLETQDTFIIYKSLESGKFLVRGEKVTGQCPTLICPECKEQGRIYNKQCGFTRNLHAKKRR